MYKGYKIRLFPTPEQETFLWEHYHTCRFMWNYMLSLQEDNYSNGIHLMTNFDMCKHITQMKSQPEYYWIGNVSRKSLEIICKDLYRAYVEFFKGLRKHPKYKTKRDNKVSIPMSQDGKCYFKSEKVIRLPKIGDVKCRDGLDKTDKLCDPRVSLRNGKWIITFSVYFENQDLPELSNKSMGIDLGIKELATVAFGDEKIVIHNINNSRRIRLLEHKHKHLQRAIMRKFRTNGSYEKTKSITRYEKMDKEIMYKLSNIRLDYVHKKTKELIDLCPNYIVMEGLNVHEMLQNKLVSKELNEVLLNEFLTKMTYKANWKGIKMTKADRYFPSTKLCSNCGNKKKTIKLSQRIYNCDKCGISIDRDYNAALNLMRYVSHTERHTA